MEEAFLRTLRDEPHDLVARRAYADWLEEQGRARVRYLRLQVEQAGLHNRRQRFYELALEKRPVGDRLPREWREQVGSPAVPLVGQIIHYYIEVDNDFGEDRIRYADSAFGLVTAEGPGSLDYVQVRLASGWPTLALAPEPGPTATLLKQGHPPDSLLVNRSQCAGCAPGGYWSLWLWELGDGADDEATVERVVAHAAGVPAPAVPTRVYRSAEYVRAECEKAAALEGPELWRPLGPSPWEGEFRLAVCFTQAVPNELLRAISNTLHSRLCTAEVGRVVRLAASSHGPPPACQIVFAVHNVRAAARVLEREMREQDVERGAWSLRPEPG